MLRYSSALTVGHFQGARRLFSIFSLCFNLFGRNSTYD